MGYDKFLLSDKTIIFPPQKQHVHNNESVKKQFIGKIINKWKFRER